MMQPSSIRAPFSHSGKGVFPWSQFQVGSCRVIIETPDMEVKNIAMLLHVSLYVFLIFCYVHVLFTPSYFYREREDFYVWEVRLNYLNAR